MATTKSIPEGLLEQLRRDREKIAAELPELIERGQRLEEAASENSFCGHLRRAIHRSRQGLTKVAAEVGLDVFVLCDFLEGTRTLRSDVLDRLAQAVGATIHMEPTLPDRPAPPARPTQTDQAKENDS
jgi:DNA-binding phage protein